MTIVLDPALAAVLAGSRLPINRRPSLPSVLVSPDTMQAQLEGPWLGMDPLPRPRQRAFLQLTDHIEGVDGGRSSLEFMFNERRLSGSALEIVEDCARRHAHLATVTIALIARAKASGGVLPSSAFFWARSGDPAFWLMVNGFGRPSHFPAIAGAFEHYSAECREGTPLPVTHFDASIVHVGGDEAYEPDWSALAERANAKHDRWDIDVVRGLKS